MTLLNDIAAATADTRILTGQDTAPWRQDWTGGYSADPIAVLRPAHTADVSAILRIAHATGTPVVPVSGNTGLVGGTSGSGMLMLSLDRMNSIRDLDATGRTATVESGVILSHLHDAAEAADLIFPMTFGARGSAMIGGLLSTNAGGSNVLRYGNTRDLCLGLEVVMADGQVMDLMGRLHKDNSGLNLKHLMIGAEGTLGVITASVMKLFPRPRARATAMAAVATLSDALALLNILQDQTGGLVDAFEYMPDRFITGHLAIDPAARPPFADRHPVNLLIELAATAPRDTTPDATGAIPLDDLLTNALMDSGVILDAVVAQNDTQRAAMWHRREAAAEIAFARRPFIDTDVAVALTDVDTFLTRVATELARIDPAATDLAVAHLGDGNIHYTAYPSSDDPVLKDQIRSMIEDVTLSLRGSFSAEHGVGLSKLSSMQRRKDPVALSTMRAIKTALDPKGILNPGKVFPPAG